MVHLVKFMRIQHNLFVARFIGEINVFDATVIERKSDDELLANVEGRVCDIHTSISAEKGQKLQVLLRPEDIVIEESLMKMKHSKCNYLVALWIVPIKG